MSRPAELTPLERKASRLAWSLRSLACGAHLLVRPAMHGGYYVGTVDLLEFADIAMVEEFLDAQLREFASLKAVNYVLAPDGMP